MQPTLSAAPERGNPAIESGLFQKALFFSHIFCAAVKSIFSTGFTRP
jgi:hypothetical protein